MADLAGLALIVVTAAAASTVAGRVSAPREAVYVVAGLVLGRLAVTPDVTVLAEVGAVLVIFLTAMHLHVTGIRDVLDDAAWVSAGQVVLLAAAAGAAHVAGLPLLDAVLVGLACGVSSSMLGIDLIGSQVDRNRLHGRLTDAVNLVQDLVAVVLIAVMPVAAGLGRPVGAAAVLLAVVAVLRVQDEVRGVLVWLGRDAATAVLAGLAVLWLAAAGLSWWPYGTVVAPVLAGLLLAGHPENIDVLEALDPVRDMFGALFFVVLGVLVTPSAAALPLAALLFVAVAVVRPVLVAAVLRRRGVPLHASVMTAMQLDQVSEIVLLVALLGTVSGTVTAATGDAVVLAAAAGFVVSAYTTRHADAIYHRVAHRLVDVDAAVDRDGHVVVAGYGRWGAAVAAAVEDPVVVDDDQERVAQARRDGYETVMGDVRDRATWTRVAVDRARLVVLTVQDDTAAARLADLAGERLVAVTRTAAGAERIRDRVVFAADAAMLTAAALREVLAAELDGA